MNFSSKKRSVARSAIGSFVKGAAIIELLTRATINVKVPQEEQ